MDMEIKELGEFKLIERLTKDIKPSNPSTITGVGDDAAVLRYSDKEIRRFLSLPIYLWREFNSILLILI